MTHRCTAADRREPDAPRSAAADIHRRRLTYLQPLPAAGAPDGGRRHRSVREPSSRDSFRTRRSGRGCGTGLPHKARRPWVPMVAVITVAEEFGTGRGTMFDILELLFGNDYVVPCTFGELTGTSASGALQCPAGRRALCCRQRGGRRRWASADAATPATTTR